ncbi:oxygenase MpaB family protein [Streptomyces sp. NPDC059651]|uniref:oxygenase MpaB family protein n=1 Tax=Streptomyces sp. NPDC059651 TaxID=3346897 RepID=UPI003684E94D
MLGLHRPVRAVHSDAPLFIGVLRFIGGHKALFIGVLRFTGGHKALLLQSPRPLALAAADARSGFRGDPWERQQRTGTWRQTLARRRHGSACSHGPAPLGLASAGSRSPRAADHGLSPARPRGGLAPDVPGCPLPAGQLVLPGQPRISRWCRRGGRPPLPPGSTSHGRGRNGSPGCPAGPSRH